MVDCAFYDDLREKFKNVLLKEGIEFGEERKRLLQLLLGTGLQGANKEAAKLRQETLNFCRGAMRRRRAVFWGWTKEFEKRFFGSIVNVVVSVIFAGVVCLPSEHQPYWI